MLVHFDELPPLGRDFSWRIDAVDPAVECCLETPLEAVCHVRPAGRNRAEIAGAIRGTVLLACDRCLDLYPFRLDSEFLVQAVVLDAALPGAAGGVAGDGPGPEDLDLVEVDAPCVNLADLMRQQIMLALPEKRVCRADCAGLCPRCGASRNGPPCGCEQTTTPSSFAALAALRGRTAK